MASVVALTSLVVSGNQATATPSEPLADQTPVIHLVERVADGPVFDDRGAPGVSVGDRLIFSADLFDHHEQRIGRDGADCVVVRIDPSQAASAQQVVQCTVTVQLPTGQITFQGLAQGIDNRFALTGGTGVYRAAHGDAHVVDRVPLSEADVTITFVR